MASFDYVSALAAAAVYEHANKSYERDRLLNILRQLTDSSEFNQDKPCLPSIYINNLSEEEKGNAISELKNQIKSMRDAPICEALRKLNWNSIDELSSVELGIGVERGFYAVPFVRNNSGNVEVIIAFRGSDNVFNWVDNLREFSTINLWPAIENTLADLKKDTIPNINISAMKTRVSLSEIATDYTEKIRQSLRSLALPEMHLRFTGHSLGGYLSLRESLRTHFPATVFENPGFPSELVDEDYQYCQKSIREFLSEPNAVNTMGHHAGQVFLVPMDLSAGEYIASKNVFRMDVEKFGPISLRISGLSYFINFGARSLNPIAQSVILSRLSKHTTNIAYSAGVTAGSGFLVCLFSDYFFSTDTTRQFVRYSVEGASALVYNGTRQLANSLVEQGSEYLPHYLPFMTDTLKSHSMNHMIQRGFTALGVIQNSFVVLYQGKQACWPKANTNGCELTSNHIRLDYTITSKALAVTVNSNERLYISIKKICTTLRAEQEKCNQVIQQKKLQLTSNQSQLEKMNQSVSLCQSKEKSFSGTLNELRLSLDVTRRSRGIAGENYENGQYKFKPSSRRLEKLRANYHDAESLVIDIKHQINDIETKLHQSKNNKKQMFSKRSKIEIENSEAKNHIELGEKNLEKFCQNINDMEIVCDYLEQQCLKKLSREIITVGVLTAAMFCTLMQPPREEYNAGLAVSPNSPRHKIKG